MILRLYLKFLLIKKPWYDFWKKNDTEKIIIELIDIHKEDVKFDENTVEFFIPVKNSK